MHKGPDGDARLHWFFFDHDHLFLTLFSYSWELVFCCWGGQRYKSSDAPIRLRCADFFVFLVFVPILPTRIVRFHCSSPPSLSKCNSSLQPQFLSSMSSSHCSPSQLPLQPPKLLLHHQQEQPPTTNAAHALQENSARSPNVVFSRPPIL